MSDPAPRPRWLRRELLVRLMLPLLAIVALAGMLGASTAQRLTDRVFDRWLLDSARSLADQVRFVDRRAQLELPQVAHAMLAYDEVDRVDYGIEQDGRLLLGRAGIPHAGERELAYPSGRAYDAVFDGRAVRVAAVEVDVSVDGGSHGHTIVLMAETTLKRQETQRQVLAMLLPMVLLLAGAAFAIDYALRSALRPLNVIAERWNHLSHSSLEPIGVDEVPRELLPFAGALNDLLRRIRAMLERERQFVTTVAHQLRTPLAGLRLGLARAAEAPDLPTSRQLLGELDRSTQRTARLLQQLLAIGRLDPEVRGDLDYVATDLVALAHDVGATYMESALDRHIDLELQAPDGPVRATVQPVLMSEALGNLLDNALRYTPRGGRVQIEFDPVGPAIQISDSGPGIAADERERVFDRMVRGRTAEGEGSGLGLSIVRDIAALHDATVTLDTGPLGGTRVTLRFGQARQGGTR
jgi:two-component system sensor histidine kinase TctE